MADRESNGGKKVSLYSKSGGRKFTQSCSRCRASKLKCDKSEPCMECMKRNLGHLCTKDECQPRAKRAKRNQKDNGHTENNNLQGQDTEVEEAANVLEQFVDGSGGIHGYTSAGLGAASSIVAPDFTNRYWYDNKDLQRENDKHGLIREIIDALPEMDILQLLYEVFVTRCQGPLGNIIHTPTFINGAGKFYNCLGLISPDLQITALLSTMSLDTLAYYLFALGLALAFHPTPNIQGWCSTPLTLRVEALRSNPLQSKRWSSLAVRCLHGGTSLFCGSIPSLQAAIMFLLDGQEEDLALDAILVTAISGAQKLGLHQLGEVKLMASELSTSTAGTHYSMSDELPQIRTEIGTRIWWALVMRDWSRGQSLGYYSIHPSQFTTRKPLHINDDDLCSNILSIDNHGYIIERPRSEFTMLSYTIHALEIATFARQSIDLRSLRHQAEGREPMKAKLKPLDDLNNKYEKFVTGLASYFRLGSTVGLTSTGPMAAIPVHRWMLHQQLWSLFLKLHRASVSSQSGRASCQLLAQNIISTSTQIQTRCAVCGSLSTSDTQLFSAAIVLLIDILFASKRQSSDRSSAQLSRLMTRDKVREAIELLQSSSDARGQLDTVDLQFQRRGASIQRSIVTLEALMKLDEEESGDYEDEGIGRSLAGSREGTQSIQSGGGESRSLKDKIGDILRGFHADANNPVAVPGSPSSSMLSIPDLSMPFPVAVDRAQDFDALPLLSDDLSNDLWQFFDFSQPVHQSSHESSLF